MNESRAGLGMLDNMRSLQRILETRCNGNVAELVRRTGKSRTNIEQYIGLSRLTDKAQALAHEDIPEKDRLKLGTAIRLSELDPKYQNILVERLKKGELGRTATDQIRAIDEYMLLHGNMSSGAKERSDAIGKLSHNREKIIGFPTAVRTRLMTLAAFSEAELDAVCKSVPIDELRFLLSSYEVLIKSTLDFHARLRTAVDKRGTVGERIAGMLPGWLVVDYYDEGKFKQFKKAVSPSKYKLLTAAGWMAYQIEEKPRPENYPDPDTLAAD